MIQNFYITGSGQARPGSRQTIFADGSADDSYREGVDLELSHWIPNRTPERFKADTTTEICMKFVAAQRSQDWDLAINNHLDVDGVLSIFTLVHSEFALQHRDVITAAAAMGDFAGWGERKAQVLFQGLTSFYSGLKAARTDVREIYERCFEEVFLLLERDESEFPEVLPGLRALEESAERVRSGQIVRREYGKRFVHYHLPRELTVQSVEKALYLPAFNELLGDGAWLLPQVRHKHDREKVHLVSAMSPEGDGWYYDLHYPGYMWAETPDSWRGPGFAFSGSTNGHYYGHDDLNRVVMQLQMLESSHGKWTLATELNPFASIKGRRFPVVLSFLDEQHHPAKSALPPEQAAFLLAGVFG